MALSAPSFRNWSNQDTQRLFKQWDSIRDKNREQYQGFADNYYQNRLRYQPLLDALKPVNKRLTKIKDLTKIISQNTMSNLQRMDKGKKLDALAAFIKQLSRFGDDDGANEIESTLFGSDTNARGFFEKIYFSNNKTSSTNDPEEYRKLMEMIDDEQIDAVISLALSNEDYMEPLEDIINQTAEYERDFEGTQEPYDYLGDINLPEESQPPTQYGGIPPYSPPPPYSLPPSYRDVVSPPPPYSLPPSYSDITPPPSYSDITPPPSYSSLYPPRVPPPYTEPRADPRVPPPYPADAPAFELPRSWGSIEEVVRKQRKPDAKIVALAGALNFLGNVPRDVVDRIIEEIGIDRSRDEIMTLIEQRFAEVQTEGYDFGDFTEDEKVKILNGWILGLLGGNKRRFNVVDKFEMTSKDKMIDFLSLLKTTDQQLEELLKSEGRPERDIAVSFKLRGAKARVSGLADAGLSINANEEWELFGEPVLFPDPLHIKVGNNSYLLTGGLLRLILSNNPEIYTNYVDDIDRTMYMRIAADNLQKKLNRVGEEKLARISSVLGSTNVEEIARETKTPTGEGYERTKKMRREILRLEKKMAKRQTKKTKATKAKAQKREEELAPLVKEIKKIEKKTSKIQKSLKGKGEFSNSMTFQANTRKRDRAQATKQVNEGITFGQGMPQMSKPLKEVHPSKLKNKLVLLKGSQGAGNNGKKVQAEIKKIEGELKRRGLM